MRIYQAVVVALAALALSSCGDTPPTAPVASGWTMSYSQGTSLSQSQGAIWQFPFPSHPGHVNMVTKRTGALSGQLTAVVEESEDNPAWFWKFDAGNTCSATLPTTSLYFQRAGDNMSGQGEFEFYRWWSAGFEIQPSLRTISVPLDPAKWGSVFGKRGTDNPAMFAAALANAISVGLVFGGGCFAGHGVAVTDGSATLKLKSFSP